MRPDTSEEMARLNLTPGVVDLGETLTHPAMGIEVPRSSPRCDQDLLELGLASEAPGGGLGRRLFGPSPSLARSMPQGISSAASAAAAHWAKGQLRWAAVASASVVVGLLTGLLSLVAFAFVWALFAAAVLVHEVGHVVAYRALAPPDAPAILVVRGTRCHLVRLRLTPFADVAVALAGPLAPCIVAVPLVALLWADGAGPWAPLTFWAWCALALSHAVCAALPFGDGATIREGLRLARRKCPLKRFKPESGPQSRDASPPQVPTAASAGRRRCQRRSLP